LIQYQIRGDLIADQKLQMTGRRENLGAVFFLGNAALKDAFCRKRAGQASAIFLFRPLNHALIRSVYQDPHCYAAIADDQKAWPVRGSDVTRRPCVFPRLQNRKICGDMRHEHVFSVLAWTRLELSTNSDLCMLIEPDR